MYNNFKLIVPAIMLAITCNTPKNEKVKLITLDPGHFHAALVQKSMYDGVDSVVHVYASEGPDLALHLAKINSFNNRADNPTRWIEDVYTGNNFFEKMLEDRSGNVVIMAGNNRLKTEYIKKSIDARFNVLADKPMAINDANFDLLKAAFEKANEKKLLLYDIMTERYEITNILQRELSMLPEVFGTLQKGTLEKPGMEMESVHYLYKYVSGSVLTRPSWFLDIAQQGDGIADVGVHLVDLAQWACFPDKAINYTKDIKLISARRWPTTVSLTEFKAITGQNIFPNYLKEYTQHDTILNFYGNGEIRYQLKGINLKLTVKWDYKAPEGGDTHYSLMRGSLADIVIRQGKEQGYKPVLYIESQHINDAVYVNAVLQKLPLLQAKYPGVDLKKNATGWEMIIPEKYKEGHEAHFARVTEKYLEYLKNGNMPAWEVPCMIAKYYTTTSTLELAKK